jgi:hypothetical protein
MSRITKPAPYGHHFVHLADAYQLCARCGKILSVGETVQVVYRGDRGARWGYVNPLGPDWWGIYTHVEGPACPPKAVSGWDAVRRAIDMRGPDAPTGAKMEALGKRKGLEAQPATLWGSVFPFVSLLDREHCNVEMLAVTIGCREILNSDRSPAHLRSDGRESDKTDDVGENEDDPKKAGKGYDHLDGAYIQAMDAKEKRGAARARDEFGAELIRAISGLPIFEHLHTRMLLARTLICALNRGRRRHRNAHTMLGECAELIREVTAQERANLYVEVCAVRDCMFELFYPSSEMSAPEDSEEGVTHGEVLTWDIVGRPVEYALYSRMPVTFGEHGDKKFWLEGKALDEFRLHLLSGPKPEPFLLVFDSRRCPQRFE